MKPLYRDKDGVATSLSQAVYDKRIRLLSNLTSLLSFIGFGAAILAGEYTRENLRFRASLAASDLVKYRRLLWPLMSLNCLRLCGKDFPLTIYITSLRGFGLSVLLFASTLSCSGSNANASYVDGCLHSFQLLAAGLLLVIQILIPRRPDVFTSEGRPVDLEGSVSAFSRYSMQWCNDALKLAGQPNKVDDLPVLDYDTRSRSLPSLLENSTGSILWYRIIKGRFSGFVKQWTLMLARSIVAFGPPYCTMRLLKCLEDTRGGDDAWIWLVGITVSSICQQLLNYQLVWIHWSEMGIPVRAQLIMTIFRKALRRKDSRDQTQSTKSKTPSRPEAVNLIASDTLSLAKFTAVNYMIPAAFVRLILAILFLLELLGWQSTLAGLLATAFCIPVHTYCIKQERTAQKNLTSTRDRKTKAVTEALHALRQIKFSALEAQWEQHINSFRREELKLLRRRFAAKRVRSIWAVIAPFIVALTSIFVYAYAQGDLAPSIIFPMIEVLLVLQSTMGFLPVVFLDYFGARLNASRIDDFLSRPEQKEILLPSPSGSIALRDATIAWPSDTIDTGTEKPGVNSSRFTLHGVNLEFPVGQLSIIGGKTGVGKSLLLTAIIGEVDLLSGNISAPSMAQEYSVAFVSQTPWLQNASLKNNILFGKPLQHERYEEVLSACALRPDLAVLAKGDETQIGLRGVKLSGGQRARVAFARALYSNAQLLVLDDIFSALDTQVAREILNALTGPLGAGRTRVLVTHHLDMCLPRSACVAIVEDNTVTFAAASERITKNVTAEIASGGNIIVRTVSLPIDGKPLTEETGTKSTKTPKQARDVDARTSSHLYKKYFAAAGGLKFLFLYMLGVFVKQPLNAFSTWLMGRINSSRSTGLSDVPRFISLTSLGIEHYLSAYLFTAFMAVVLEMLFNLHTFSGSLRASDSMFQEMATRVLRMPLLWLDTTSMGEMLRRFTVDTRIVDDSLLMDITEFADCCVKLVSIIIVALYTSKFASIIIALLLLWSAHVSRAYIKARTVVKRADVEPTSNILEHFTSTVAGLSTIRAFGATDQMIEHLHTQIDRLSTAKRHFWIFNRWMGLRVSLLGIVLSTSTGAILLCSYQHLATDPSFLGFALTFSMGFSQAIYKSVNNWGILETDTDAAGRIIEYTELKTEDQGGIDVSPTWPSKGDLEIKNLSVAYAPALPLVLKNISISIPAGTKTGIAGRTGAGKSSLSLALLKLLEARQGAIFIDGIDIATVKLRDLRNRIAFIPQDPALFSGTIRDNLDYFKRIPEHRLLHALDSVKLLGEDEKGLFTLESKVSPGGANMSQGQRQLLCLARVILMCGSGTEAEKPKIVILDEATSAMDVQIEETIRRTVERELGGTLIVVAHRLRSLRGFDQVLVMSEGEIAESGSPEELMVRKGLFYDLVDGSQDRELLMDYWTAC